MQGTTASLYVCMLAFFQGFASFLWDAGTADT